MNFEILQLKPGKEKALQRKHPWVFSGAFKEIPPHLKEGQVVAVHDNKGQFRAAGFFHKGSITVKVISFTPLTNFDSWLKDTINNAIDYRKQAGIFNIAHTNCHRLIFAEGDRLPGLIVDRYDTTAVMQIHHSGWIPFIQSISDILVSTGVVSQVYSKPSDKIEVDEKHKGWVIGGSSQNLVSEYGHTFKIDWEEGQKTGFFLDQRENRKRLADFCRGKTVLNTFSYTGGFSVYALAAGASHVTSVDISQPAVDLANENARLNNFAENHTGIAEDVFGYLKNEGANFDIIILDPPAFSKSIRTAHNAVQGYKRLNKLAIEKIKPQGIIFTFSCSQHVNTKLFEDTIRAAAIEAGRTIRIVEKLSQPADHPINVYHPEGEYLKGLILYVE